MRKQRSRISEMMFPPARQRTRPLLGMLSATALAATCFSFGAATAAADNDPPPPPPLHNVHYTVWAEQPFNVSIYYRDTDPPNWADYSHNPYAVQPQGRGRCRAEPAMESRRWTGEPRRMGDGGGEAPAGSQRRAPTSTVRSPWTASSSRPIRALKVRSARFATGNRPAPEVVRLRVGAAIPRST